MTVPDKTRVAFVLLLGWLALIHTVPAPAAEDGVRGEFVIHKALPAPERLNFANHVWNCNRGWSAGEAYNGRERLSADEGQVDAMGYPVLDAGAKAITQLVVPENGARALLTGRMTVTWRGDAAVRVTGGATVASLRARRLELDVTGTFDLTVTAGRDYADAPLRHLRIWVPDPKDPAARSLAPAAGGEREPVFHPTYLDYWRLPGVGVWRMAWAQFNNNPQETWEHTRHPDHCFMIGSVRRKQVPGREPRTAELNEVSWQHCVTLANELGVDIWLNLPHGATDEYVRDLARLMLYGADADGKPYPAMPQSHPAYPALDPDRKVYVELSNEMWHPGFHQGVVMYQTHERLGIPWGAAPARRVSEMWSLFQEEFEKANPAWRERLVRVAACSDNRVPWTREFVEEAVAYGAKLPELKPEETIGGGTYSQATRPDVLAMANYFGNSIDQYAVEMSAPGSTHPFWAEGDAPLDAVFREWALRLMTGSPGTNWVNSTKGTLEVDFIAIAREHGLQIIGYEGGYGGPSLDRPLYVKYPEVEFVDRGNRAAREAPGVEEGNLPEQAARVAKLAGADVDGAEVFRRFVRFRVMEAQGMEDVMRLQLELLKWAGVRLPCNSTEFDNAAVQRDWGLSEYLPEPLAEAPRRRAVVHFLEDHLDLNEVGEAHGAGAPDFTTPASILAYEGRALEPVRIEAAGGDGPLRIRAFGSWMPPGLRFDADALVLSGTPTTRELGYIFARVSDADGDVAYRMFRVETLDPKIGRPAWRETFNELPDGTAEDAGETAWTVEKVGDVVGTCDVRAGVLSAIGVKEERGKGEVVWKSETIDIGEYDTVNLFLRVTSNDEVDRGGDWMRIHYRLDGGEPVQVADFSGENAQVKDPVIVVPGLQGRTLQVTASMTNMNIEMYGLDEVSVFVP